MRTPHGVRQPIQIGDEIKLAGVQQGVATVIDNTHARADRLAISGTNLAVSAGDVLAFEFSKTGGQSVGSISGLEQTVTFSAAPVPLPAAALLFGSAAAGLGFARRRVAWRCSEIFR